MRIEIQPKPDGMQHINLMFCEEQPDPEDAWIFDRIKEFPVPPKRILEWQRDGREYKVLQFGQCVIGHVMFDIEKHKGIVDKIQSVCLHDFEQTQGAYELAPETLSALIADTALAFHKQARFTVDGSGELSIDIDEQEVREYILQQIEKEQAVQPV